METEALEEIWPERVCLNCLGRKEPGLDCPNCGWSGESLFVSPLFLPPGTVLKEKYLVGKVLGHGGFGVTYMALDLSLALRVCLKEYFPASLATRSAPQNLYVQVFSGEAGELYDLGLRSFLREAQILARFEDHPGIMSVRDYFEANGTAYMVTSYFNGITLKTYLEQKGGSIPFPLALKILMPVMDSLRSVHSAGLLHRDISPENIYLTDDGQVKLLDFGAATRMETPYEDSISVVVKPGYAPEEQYRSGGELGPWSDVYGVAATLYRAITGIVPPDALDRLHQDSLKLPSDLGVQIPKHAESALTKALAVNSRDRFQDIYSFQRALMEERPQRVQAEGDRPGPRKSRRRTRPLAIVALVFACGTLYFLWSDSPDRLYREGKSLYERGSYERALEYLFEAKGKAGGDLLRRIDLAAAEILLRLNRPEEAIGELKKIVEEEPGSAEGWSLLGDAYSAISRPEEAYRAYMNACRASPEDAALWLKAGEMAEGLGRENEALEAYENALLYDDGPPELWSKVGVLYESSGRFDKAAQAYRKAADLAPDDAEAWRRLGFALMNASDFEGASEALSHLTDLAPTDADAWTTLGEALRASGDKEGAIRAFRIGARLSPERADVWGKLGVVLLEVGRYSEATEAFLRATTLSLADGQYWYQLGFSYMASGTPQSAIEPLQRAVELRPDRARWWQLLGEALVKSGRYDEAIAALEKAVKTDQDDVEGWLALGGAYLKQSRFEEALESFRRAEGLSPWDYRALLGRGRSLLSQGHLEDASGALREAARLAPNEAEPWVGIGELYMKLNQYDRAVESLKRAIKLEPDDDTAWKLLGQAYYLWGQYDGAIEAYSALVEKMPEGKNNESEYYELAISYIKVGDTASAQRILSLLEEKNSSYAQELRKALQER